MNEMENIYFRCRKEAAKHNDRLNSREGAAEMLGISVSSLANYELGITKVVPVDAVIMMADLYQAPELKAHYCKHTCPLGAEREICTEAGSVERLAVRLARMTRKRSLEDISDRLLDIAEDGRITAEEREALQELAQRMDEMALMAQEMRLLAEGRHAC